MYYELEVKDVNGETERGVSHSPFESDEEAISFYGEDVNKHFFLLKRAFVESFRIIKVSGFHDENGCYGQHEEDICEVQMSEIHKWYCKHPYVSK